MALHHGHIFVAKQKNLGKNKETISSSINSFNFTQKTLLYSDETSKYSVEQMKGIATEENLVIDTE